MITFLIAVGMFIFGCTLKEILIFVGFVMVMKFAMSEYA